MTLAGPHLSRYGEEAMSTPSKDPWLLDIRIRQRNVKKGLVDEKEVEKHLASLPDLSAQADTVTLPQPALTGSEEADEKG